MRKTRLICVVLLGFNMGSTLAVKCDLILAVRIEIFEYLHENSYRHMPWSRGHRLVQTNK